VSIFAEKPFSEWVLARPAEVQRLMIDWPPQAQVRAKEGERLMIPAPGVVGEVVSWFEGGSVGVLAPLVVDMTAARGGELNAGDELSAECDPAKLEIVEFATFGETLIDHDCIRSIVEGAP
jgi:hypothetical protein